jgi:hypothetical protein
LLALAVACVGTAVGTAVAVGADTSSPQRTSLEEIAAAASGRPGELMPRCPDEETVTRLKDAGLEFGPCDPWPEDGAAMRVPPVSEPTPESDGKVVCPGVILGKGVDLKVTIPCGHGAKIVAAEALTVDGSYCARVTYIAGTGSPARTETLCEGDVPSVGGEPVTGPSAAETRF